MLTETFLRYGQPEPPAKLLPLRAGPLALLYDPTSGMLRRIKLGEVEVLRGIYAAVRDRNWGTVPGTLRERVRKVEQHSFQIEFESEHQQGNIHFTWRGIVRGDASGTLRYEFDGSAKTTFLRNRIGCCVLHPLRECAGARARQFRVDGTQIECRFPELIEPQIFGRSSFRELRGVAHEVAPGVSAQVEFEGDTFEMEDQRNWTDASFKTYCTPLALPFPVEIKAGSRICQAITLKLSGDSARLRPPTIEIISPPADAVRLTVPEAPTGRLPSIGLGVASHGEPLSDAEIDTLGQLRLSHLRVDVRLAAPESEATLRRAVREATQLNARLELALHLPREGGAAPGAWLQVLNQPATPVARILALREGEPATSLETLTWVRKHFGSLGAPIGAGSDCNFCELNREQALGRLALPHSDFLFWPINPQVHAFDHLSLMETLEAQTATAVSARAFAVGRPLTISPVTLKPRFNPVVTSAAESSPAGELPAQVDARQLSHFAAAWTLGSNAALAAAGVDSVTYYETSGWRGVMERAAGSALPETFPSIPGAPFPVFHALAHLAGFSQVALVSNPSLPELLALGLFAENRLRRVLVANLTATNHTADVTLPNNTAARLELQPYEVARADFRT
jgi:hypothetical protein